MSTRCQIGFYEKPDQKLEKPSILIYRHSDGYPTQGGALDDIKEFSKLFMQYRGWDPEYFAAQLLAWMVRKSQDHMLEWNKERYARRGEPMPEEYQYDFLGYGVCGNRKFHGDIEWYYGIDKEGITVYEVSGWGRHTFTPRQRILFADL